ncbi:MAG: hypothetical protein IPF57_22405 [Gammaproteobacteria bacterium]|jgi:hypothetical protein|nr:hypothetical protein [Gammaproteobacteria bacterium]
MRFSALLTGGLLQLFSLAAFTYPVAGLAPDRRPEGAPVMLLPERAVASLQGVSEPVPESIQRWVIDQGAWFNPFFHPGMVGCYDLRGFHGQAEPRQE